MARWDPARWLRAALLLLWVPGCLSLSGPHHMRGTVGGSLSVQCRYEEKFRGNKKYWYTTKPPWPWSLTRKIVETMESKKEVRSDRVSIRDHPANLTFTVTMENLTESDDGTYGCGIDVSWLQGIVDPNFEVVVTVSPAPAPPSPTAAKTLTITTTTARITTVSTALATAKATQGPNSLDGPPPSHGFPVLLSLSVLLLFLLVGASLLAWRMVRRRVKADKNPEPPQNPNESEPCYANLELQTWRLLEEPVQPAHVEVEYSTVAPQEDPQYTTVVFNSQTQDSKGNRAPSQRPPQLESEYSVIRKT